jgi:hypothetical protein
MSDHPEVLLRVDVPDGMTFAPAVPANHTRTIEAVEWNGARALRLDGLALLPQALPADLRLEADVAVEEPAYPGFVFHAADAETFELAYAVPHASGLWDAIQYDPVAHGGNTWQLHHGPCFQAAAEIPTGRWFHLRVDVCGGRAAVRVDNQTPLIVPHLFHGLRAGLAGLWTYRPAFFRNLEIRDDAEVPAAPVSPDGRSSVGAGAGESETGDPATRRGDPGGMPWIPVDAWSLQGHGRVLCESGARLVLNRYLPARDEAAVLERHFAIAEEGTVGLSFGFSDTLVLEIDGTPAFTGENIFRGFADRPSRGYAELGTYRVERRLDPGSHRIGVRLGATEPFGWGLVLEMRGPGLRLLQPA